MNVAFMDNREELVRAIEASILNHEHCRSKEEKHGGLLYKIKYIVWYMLLILISPYKESKSDKFVCCFTPVNRMRMKSYADEEEVYFFGQQNSSLNTMKVNRSFFSDCKFNRRCRIATSGFVFFLRNRQRLKGNLHFVLEYYSIYKFLIDHPINKIVTPGMYDRYCTFISYIGHSLHIKLIGVQDGAAININVPKKIYCNEMYAFDKYEAEIIRGFIRNENCKFIYTGFSSIINWDMYPKTEKRIIAIASQDWFTSRTINLIDELMSIIDKKKFLVIVFPHYRESLDDYNDLKKRHPYLIVEPIKRYKNIDLLITFYSTIVYDFWSVNERLDVVCLRIQGYEPSYYTRPNVNVISYPKQIVEYLNKL